MKFPVYRTDGVVSTAEVAMRHLANLREELRQRLDIQDPALLAEIVEEAVADALHSLHAANGLKVLAHE